MFFNILLHFSGDVAAAPPYRECIKFQISSSDGIEPQGRDKMIYALCPVAILMRLPWALK
jgi:hypothetical protein